MCMCEMIIKMSLRHLYLDLLSLGVYPDISKNDEPNEFKVTGTGRYNFSKYYGNILKYERQDKNIISFHDISGRLHRDDNNPAYYDIFMVYDELVTTGFIESIMSHPKMILPNNSVEWYKHGLLHRDDGPARTTGYYSLSWGWYINGVKCTDDIPSILIDWLKSDDNTDITSMVSIHGRDVKFTSEDGTINVFTMNRRYTQNNHELVFNKHSMMIKCKNTWNGRRMVRIMYTGIIIWKEYCKNGKMTDRYQYNKNGVLSSHTRYVNGKKIKHNT